MCTNPVPVFTRERGQRAGLFVFLHPISCGSSRRARSSHASPDRFKCSLNPAHPGQPTRPGFEPGSTRKRKNPVPGPIFSRRGVGLAVAAFAAPPAIDPPAAACALYSLTPSLRCRVVSFSLSEFHSVRSGHRCRVAVGGTSAKTPESESRPHAEERPPRWRPPT